jgi:hypothetical protein
MLISDKHKQQYIEYYSTRPQTPRPHAWQEQVEKIAGDFGVDTVLDYGAGITRSLSRFSSLNVTDYDPVLPKQSNLYGYKPFDMVVCNHVLEHVEEETLNNVLTSINQLTKKVAYIAVSCEASTKKLPDGTDWHCTVHPPEWWKHRLAHFFPGFAELRCNEKELAILWSR